MGCIISGKGVKTRWSNNTLCGNTVSVNDIVEFFQGKVTCAECLIRQDAMLERGYAQTNYSVYWNRKSRYNMVLHGKTWYGTIIPRRAYYIPSILMWDADIVKLAVKAGKLGINGMGLAK
jgi:hypothetical protein